MDKITEAVKAQYNNFPYPSIPIGELHDEVLYSTNYEFVNYICTRNYKTSKEIKILDAGCGTGFSTLKLAQQNPDAEITAIDLSANSIKMAKERLEKAGISLKKINFIEADLLNLPEIKDKFDYIVCTGVLHHTSSPEKALKNLVNLLSEDGLMYLMLYSEYGRFYLNQMRSLIKILQEDKTSLEEGLSIGKEILSSLSENNNILINYKKSYQASVSLLGESFALSDAQFIDAYVNSHERTYNIEQLFDLIATNNLNFIRFHDEPLWDINKLFKNNKLLIEKSKNLSQKEKYKLGEIINPDRNFAFFVSKKHPLSFELSDEELLKRNIILSPLNIVEENNNNKFLINPLGIGFNFTEEFAQIFLTISNLSLISDVVSELAKTFKSSELEVLEIIKMFESEFLVFII